MAAPSTRHVEVLLPRTPGAAPPVNTAAPVISGIRVVGQVLTTTDGTWTGDTGGRSYQWVRGASTLIAGATSATYTLISADVGNVHCVVSASGVGGTTPASSNVLVVVAEMVTGDAQFWTAAANGLGGSPLVQAPAPTSIYDAVSLIEATSGDIEYRALYIKNTHSVRSLTGTVVWIVTQTTSPTTDLAIGVAPQAAGSDVAAVVNESTAPSGVTFSAPTSASIGLPLGTLAPGQARGIWLRWTVLAGTTELAADTCTLAANGDPA